MADDIGGDGLAPRLNSGLPEASRVYIFELKGFSADEWIIETMALNNCNEGMILREINAIDIPDGLESEYEWNY